MINIIDGPVVPIPPSFSDEDGISEVQISSYINWLYKNGVNTIMTTAGTSQFNLLSPQEIDQFNGICAFNFPCNRIIGFPPNNLNDSLKQVREYNKLFAGLSDVYYMFLYPDRYYNNNTIKDFFHRLADESKFPILIHGMFMRSGTGGTYDYTADLVNEIRQHRNIIGMKEECTSFELAYELCRKTDDFIKIVAGKSARRFTLLHKAGAHTYLAGLGNIFPKLENSIFGKITSGQDHSQMLRNFEDPFFDVFMKIGWHKALREGLKQEGLCCFVNRKPFPECTESEIKDINNILLKIKKYI